MKKIILILISLFLFSTNVYSASSCSYKEQAELNQKASNVKISYEIKSENETDPFGRTYANEYFDISILNLTESFYVIIKNNTNQEEREIYYSDTKDNIYNFRWNDVSDITKFTFEVYSSANTNCPAEKVKTLYLTTPRFNQYSSLGVCQNLEDFELCEKYVTFTDVTDDDFYSRVEKYRKKVEEEKKEEENKNGIIDFLKNNKLYIIVGVVIVCGVAGSIVYINRKKQR